MGLAVNRAENRHEVPALVWQGGMRKLDDLLPNFGEVKGTDK